MEITLDMEQDITEEQARLREQLRLLSTKVNEDIYSRQQRIFGKIATIVEAFAVDAEQRKSLKDLVSDAIYGGSYWNDIRFEFQQFAKANGFELWENDPTAPQELSIAPGPTNAYEKV